MNKNIRSVEPWFYVRKNLLSLIFLSIMVALALSGCTSDAEKKVKSEIINASLKSESKEIYLDLSNSIDDEIKKICIQSPYMSQEGMEEVVGQRIDHFDHITDDQFFILWIFIDRKAPIQLKINRWKEFNFAEESVRCSKKSIIKIFEETLYLNQE